MLIRTALWGLAIIAAAFAVVWLKDAEGGVTLELAGRAYGPFRLLETVALVFLAALLLWLLWKAFGFCVALVRFMTGDETALSRFWNRSRERRGFDALAGGLVAMAEGDGREALAKARKAERLLARPDLTRLLVAQAARAAGDKNTAKAYFKELASAPATAFVGVSGLLEQAMKDGDRDRALKLAVHAAELKPKDAGTLTALFALQCEAKDWEGARRTLDSEAKIALIGRDVAARRSAVLLVADAREAAARGEAMKARDLAERALRQAPGLVPAAILVARQLEEDGARRKAEKTLREAWRAGPHPDLAAAFAALAPDETPRERRRRFLDLTRLQPDHPETRMLRAELALADGDPREARAALGSLTETQPTGRALALMAAIERADGGGEAVVRGWLARAVAAPRAPQWTCDACGARHGEWAPVCHRCEAFDTLAWREGEGEGAGAETAALLPIVTAEPEPEPAPKPKPAVAPQAAPVRTEAKAPEPEEAPEAAAAPLPPRPRPPQPTVQ